MSLGPAPTPPLSLNQTRGMHWAVLKKLTTPWRDLAFYTAKSHMRNQLKDVIGKPSDIQVWLPFPQERRRDPHNFMPCVKSVIDGLVRAGVWPDDTPEWLSVMEPKLFHGTDVLVWIRTKEQA